MAVAYDNVRIAVLDSYDTLIGFLDNSLDGAQYFDEELHIYLQASLSTFTCSVYKNHELADYLCEGNKLAFRYRSRSYYFTIMTVEDDEKTVTVDAEGFTFDLMAEVLDGFTGTALTFQQYLSSMNFSGVYQLDYNEVKGKVATITFQDETSLSRLYSMASVFGAEIDLQPILNNDYSLSGISVRAYKAHDSEHQGMGDDNSNISLRYGREVRGVKRKRDLSEFCSAIKPAGADGLTLQSISGRKITDEDLNILYFVEGSVLKSPVARNTYPATMLETETNRYITKTVKYDNIKNVEDLLAAALADLQYYEVPQVSYTVTGFVDGNIGDTYTIVDEGFNTVLYMEARITEQKIYFSQPASNVTTFDNFTAAVPDVEYESEGATDG